MVGYWGYVSLSLWKIRVRELTGSEVEEVYPGPRDSALCFMGKGKMTDLKKRCAWVKVHLVTVYRLD